MWWGINFVKLDNKCYEAAKAVLEVQHGVYSQPQGWLNLTALDQFYLDGGYDAAILQCTTVIPNEFLALSQPVPNGLFSGTDFTLTGLYTLLIVYVASTLRTTLQGASQRVIYEELENVNKPLSLCANVPIARENGYMNLEHKLYLTLINLYRQPAQLYLATQTKNPKTGTRENYLWSEDLLPENRPQELTMSEQYPYAKAV